MRIRIIPASLAAVLGAVGLAIAPMLAQGADAERYWPQWRGPNATGVSTTADPPMTWSETENILWKVEVPGRGSSSPVVWGDHLFVTSAVPVGVTGDAQHEPRGGLRQRGVHQFVVMAIDRATGRTVWERVATEQEPHEAGHNDNSSWASSSPVTNGEHVFAYFESFGLYAYDMDGTLVWQKDLGDKRMRNEFGEGSTPVLHGNTLIVVWDHLNGDSWVAALDARDGSELWRAPRDEIDTWATPLVMDVDGRAQVIVPAMERVRSYDLEDGRVVWESDGLTMNAIPSPVAEDGIAYLMSGFRGNDLKAIRVAGASGNIDDTDAILWTLNRDTPYVPVARALRRHPLFPEEQLRDPLGLRRPIRHAALHAAAPGRCSERIRIAGRRSGAGVCSWPRRNDARDSERPNVRGAGEQYARRRLRCIARTRRQRDVPARLLEPVRHRRELTSQRLATPTHRRPALVRRTAAPRTDQVKDLELLDVRTRRAWRSWLSKHHARSAEIWLVYHKQHTGHPTIDYNDSVEEALCYGWVDSLIRRLDDDRYARKFTPRKANSRWSTSNRRRYADLKRRGLLAPAGIQRPPTERSGDPPRPASSTVPRYISRAIKANASAWGHFQQLAPSRRRHYALWIDTAKRAETKERRLREAVRLLAAGRTLGLK